MPNGKCPTCGIDPCECEECVYCGQVDLPRLTKRGGICEHCGRRLDTYDEDSGRDADLNEHYVREEITALNKLLN